ncbi:MAG: hypothetical protein ABJC19_11725 [Gemmatimonadota bacterium]
MNASVFLSWLLIGVHLLLVLFGLVRWSRLDVGCRFTWGWAVLGLVARLLQVSLPHPADRLVVAHFYFPMSALLAAWALACYQPTRRAADAVRLAGVCYVIAWAVITPLFEDLHKFSRVTAPLRGILIAVIAGRTIRARRLLHRSPPAEDRGLLIAAGFAVLYAATGIVAPYAAAYHVSAPVTVTLLLRVRDVIVLAAMIPMLWACMLHIDIERRAA